MISIHTGRWQNHHKCANCLCLETSERDFLLSYRSTQTVSLDIVQVWKSAYIYLYQPTAHYEKEKMAQKQLLGLLYKDLPVMEQVFCRFCRTSTLYFLVQHHIIKVPLQVQIYFFFLFLPLELHCVE